LNSARDKSHNCRMQPGIRILARGLLHLVAMNTQRLSTSRGFSLIELLIVTAVIGLIAAIAIPNLVNAIQRGRQSRSTGDLRGLATGIGMYQQDYAKFPLAGSLVPVSTISDSVAPYMGDFKGTDGWQRDFFYASDGDNYTLLSYGLNGVADQPWANGPIHYFDDDIVIEGGAFVQWPEGIQQ
jgi:prepilin-type N-terminal cleavage/methylation domain-containing protein